MSKRDYDALCSFLVSTRMEGFRVTKQMKKDCICLMSSEVPATNLPKETLARPEKAL